MSSTRTPSAVRSTPSAEELPPPGTNLVVVRGVLSRDPEPRVLPSGDRLVAYEVTVRPAVAPMAPEEAAPAETVPVVWLRQPVRTPRLGAGDEVVVVGRVRRRFFRAGGATASRTEVVADRVVPIRTPARAREALRRALEGSLLC